MVWVWFYVSAWGDIADLKLTTLMAVHDNNEYIPTQGTPSLWRIYVLWLQIYDEQTRFHLFGFNSAFSESNDIDKIAVNSGGMNADIEGSGFA